MIASGLIEIQSHSYDMHQSAALENGPARTSVARLEGESDGEYEDALRSDMSRSIAEIEDATGEECFAFSYPLGVFNRQSESILHELGIRITFTTEPVLNTIKRGDPQSLLLLGRFVWADPGGQVPCSDENDLPPAGRTGLFISEKRREAPSPPA
jgi:peptidoglycan/xylan/chitin deacetylase (PgdA/CDA1 family)